MSNWRLHMNMFQTAALWPAHRILLAIGADPAQLTSRLSTAVFHAHYRGAVGLAFPLLHVAGQNIYQQANPRGTKFITSILLDLQVPSAG